MAASPSQVFAECPSPTQPLDGVLGGFPILPRPAVGRDKTTIRQLELAVAMAKAETADVTTAKDAAQIALAKSEAMYKALHADFMRTVEEMEKRHQQESESKRRQHFLELEVQSTEVKRLESKCARLEARCSETAAQLAEATASKQELQRSFDKTNRELDKLKAAQESVAADKQGGRESSSTQLQLAATESLREAAARKAEYEAAFLKSQWQEEKSCREEMQAAVHALSNKLKTLNKQLITLSVERDEALQRVRMTEAQCQQSLAALESELHAQAEDFRDQIRSAVITSEDKHTTTLAALKRSFAEEKLQQQFEEEAKVEALKSVLEKERARCCVLQYDSARWKHLCTVERVRAVRLFALLLQVDARPSRRNSLGKAPSRRRSIQDTIKALSIEEELRQAREQLAASMQRCAETEQALATAKGNSKLLETTFQSVFDMLFGFAREEAVRYKTRAVELSSVLGETEDALRELETKHAAKQGEIEQGEATVRQLEAELAALSQLSTVKADGEIDVTLVRKKRRVTLQCDGTIDRVAVLREELKIFSSRLQEAQSRLLEAKEESARLDLNMLQSTFDHNKKVLQVMQDYRSTVSANDGCVTGVADSAPSKLSGTCTPQKQCLEGA